MTSRLWLTVPVALGLLVPAAHRPPARGLPPAATSTATAVAGAGQDATTIDDQVDLAVTVYNSDLALVRDVRMLQVPPGVSTLRFMDIAATVNPSTVHFRSVSDPAAISVLEQNYEYDLLDPEQLLKKYVGREVTLVRTRQDGGTTTQDDVRARLLSFNRTPVWQIGDAIVTGIRADHVRFAELPDNLYERPTLIWTVQNGGSRAHRVETSYLAGKLSWSADYVLTVGRDDRTADLDGWVTLKNESGTAFPNASLQLVAGDLNRVRQMLGRQAVEEARPEALASAPSVTEEAFSDYHLYTLGRRTTIHNNQTKQVSLLAGTGVPVRKRYIVDGQAFYYRNSQRPGVPLKDVVQVYYEFANDAPSGLGMPMPSGTVRVYQADSRGGLQFVGEDRIGHTPRDETLDVKIGHAFDVVCERTQTDWARIGGSTYEVEYEITLRNHKATPVEVEVNEPVGGTWQMLRTSHPWEKTAAWAARFTVPVDADGTAVLSYRVRVTY